MGRQSRLGSSADTIACVESGILKMVNLRPILLYCLTSPLVMWTAADSWQDLLGDQTASRVCPAACFFPFHWFSSLLFNVIYFESPESIVLVAVHNKHLSCEIGSANDRVTLMDHLSLRLFKSPRDRDAVPSVRSGCLVEIPISQSW